MRQIAIVKVAQGYRIPLGRELRERMGLSKGDYVAIYETDAGEIALAKPEIPRIGAVEAGEGAEA